MQKVFKVTREVILSAIQDATPEADPTNLELWREGYGKLCLLEKMFICDRSELPELTEAIQVAWSKILELTDNQVREDLRS